MLDIFGRRTRVEPCFYFRIDRVMRSGSLRRNATGSREHWKRSVPRPPHWSGFRVVPELVEFWYGATYRLHERQRFERIDGQWQQRMLFP